MSEKQAPRHAAGADAQYSTTPWTADGMATIQAAGDDRRAALEGGLRAALALALADAASGPREGGRRAAPIQGEGRDLPELFADLLEALWEEVSFHGPSVQDVRVDGVLQRNGEGFVAWGYVEGPLRQQSGNRTPHLVAPPAIGEETPGRVSLRASFRRA